MVDIILPAVMGDRDTWGGKLNTALATLADAADVLGQSVGLTLPTIEGMGWGDDLDASLSELSTACTALGYPVTLQPSLDHTGRSNITSANAARLNANLEAIRDAITLAETGPPLVTIVSEDFTGTPNGNANTTTTSADRQSGNHYLFRDTIPAHSAPTSMQTQNTNTFLRWEVGPQWDVKLMSFYFYLHALPPSASREIGGLCGPWVDNFNHRNRSTLRVYSTGALDIVGTNFASPIDQGATQLAISPASTLAVGSWQRIDIEWDSSGPKTRVGVFKGANLEGSTADWSSGWVDAAPNFPQVNGAIFRHSGGFYGGWPDFPHYDDLTIKAA